MTEVIGVRFRGGCKEYYFDPHGITVEPNQFVIRHLIYCQRILRIV